MHSSLETAGDKDTGDRGDADIITGTRRTGTYSGERKGQTLETGENRDTGEWGE